MKRSIIAIFTIISAIIILMNCEMDKGPLYIEPCYCDTSEYKDPECPCDKDTMEPPCLCDTTEYKDFNCPCDKDTIPYPICLCDTSEYLDPNCPCDKDTIPHPAWCPCDTTEWHERDCKCDKDSILLISYKIEIQTILTKYCLECHYRGSDIPSYEKEDSYESLKDGGLYRKFKPGDSKIYNNVISAKPTMPPDPPYLTKKESDYIYYWILQGAMNN
jgi:hypothetical protein